ncbi:hypothetical protein N7G274_002152 [Stereocaulon virgatum]|uniref:C3H1-type domain-containing protein n=1 Tax=Stereocaulon virgatum TaxID=373712 RepID=A0ABR4ALN1_9LECA
MTVCQFFLRGNCKFGDHCKNEHPGKITAAIRNPFAPLQSGSTNHASSSSIRNSSTSRDTQYNLEKNSIINDLSKERPQWILSSYGPGKQAPLQLFGGHPREQSFEELRARHYELAAQGNEQQAIQEAEALVRNAEQQIQTALSDVDGAIKYIINGENEHPNRKDICESRGFPPVQPQPRGSNQQPASISGHPSNPAPAFGQPSAPSTFSRPSAPTFGQPSAPVSTFGQPSTLTFGQPSAFGRPSALGGPTANFGQPSSAFGKPLVPKPGFGQPFAPSPFGAPAQQRNPSLFGAPAGDTQADQPRNPFSQPSASAQASPFGKPSSPVKPNAFGQPSAPTQPNLFAPSTTSSFGQTPAAPSQPSIFGRPSAPASASPFAQSATTGNPGGNARVSTAPSNPLGQPTAPQAASILGQPSKIVPNPFGQPNPAPTAPTTKVPASMSANAQVAAASQAQMDSQGKIRNWNGKAVSYIDEEPCFRANDGQWQRIWFVDGPPTFTKTVDLPDEMYDEATKENYKYLKEHGTFRGKIMPELPPKREWCMWNF